MQKKIVLISTLLLTILMISSCSKESDSKGKLNIDNITVVVPKSPAALPVIHMVNENVFGDSCQITSEICVDMDRMMALLVEGNYEFILVPSHAAANLYNKGMNIKLLSVYNWGGLALSTTDSEFDGWSDLKGKELYVPEMGSFPDLLTQYFLKKNGLIVGKDVNIVYSNHVEIAQLISQGTIKYAVDVQPFITMNSKNVEGYKVVNFYVDEWKKTVGEELNMPGFCLVANMEKLDGKEDIIETFTSYFSDGVKWVNEEVEDAGKLAEENIGAKSSMITAAMPGFGFEYVPTSDAKDDVMAYFEVLMEMEPKTVGGELPDEAFYYIPKED